LMDKTTSFTHHHLNNIKIISFTKQKPMQVNVVKIL
jgi:hypothetical protein